jgi:hypothetical protein
MTTSFCIGNLAHKAAACCPPAQAIFASWDPQTSRSRRIDRPLSTGARRSAKFSAMLDGCGRLRGSQNTPPAARATL